VIRGVIYDLVARNRYRWFGRKNSFSRTCGLTWRPAQGLEDAAGDRDLVAALITPAQIAEAQRLAREWKPTK
jgi:hypothetical protein